MISLLLLFACAGKPGEDDCSPSIWPLDLDGDNFAGTTTVEVCERPAQAAEQGGDCDDADPSVHPGAEEVCNGKDDDCDGVVDPPALTWYVDADGDGYGDPEGPVEDCAQPEDAVGNDLDCDDSRADTYPGAEEIWYDGVDQDCDGGSDYDADRDGYDSALYGGTDCDDTNPEVNPGAEVICYNGLDDNCDGSADECELDGDTPMSRANWRIEGEGSYQWMGLEVKMIGPASPFTSRPVFAVTQADGGRLTGEAYVYLYSLEEGGPEEQTRFVSDESHYYYGYKIQDRVDFNGDGYLDITITADQASWYDDLQGPGHSMTYFGPFGREIDADDFDIGWWGRDTADRGAYRVVGPLHGEGMVGRVAVSVPTQTMESSVYMAGAVYMHEGPFEGTIAVHDSEHFVYGTEYSNYTGHNLKSTDVDGDGVSDLVLTVGQRETGDTRSMVVTFLGPVDGARTIWDNDGEVVAESRNNLGWAMDLPGDMDGDGVEEIVLGAPAHLFSDRPGAGVVWVLSMDNLLGMSEPDDHAHSRIEARYRADNDQLGSSLSHGDFNGDGEIDLIFGAERANIDDSSGVETGEGIAYGFYGLPRGVVSATRADFQIHSTTENGYASWALAGDMDLNEDGCDDILISEPNWPSQDEGFGVVGIFLGGCR